MVRGYFAQTLIDNPDVDEVLVWKPSGGWNLKNILDYVRKLRSGWDLAIVLNDVSHSFTSDVAAALSGAEWIVGSAARPFAGTHRNFLYNIEVPRVEGLRHQTLRNLDILRPLGVESTDPSPHIYLSDEEKTQASETLRGLGWDPTKPSVGLHLGAGKTSNRWSPERFAGLAEKLESQGVQVVVTWGLNENDLAHAFRSRFKGKALYVGAPPIRLLGAVFQTLSAMVVNDTGMLHLAAACGAPLVAVFGPTDPEEWCPLGPRFLSVRGDGNSVGTVSTEQVWEKLQTLLP
jgi:heptosyltransferase-2